MRKKIKGNEMISKELLNEVLNTEAASVSIIGNTVNYVVKNYETQEDDELVYIDLGANINIYELTHKCKIWAEMQGYVLIEYGLCVEIYKTQYPFEKVYKQKDLCTELFKTDRIVECCEWILKEVSKC